MHHWNRHSIDLNREQVLRTLWFLAADFMWPCTYSILISQSWIFMTKWCQQVMRGHRELQDTLSVPSDWPSACSPSFLPLLWWKKTIYLRLSTQKKNIYTECIICVYILCNSIISRYEAYIALEKMMIVYNNHDDSVIWMIVIIVMLKIVIVIAKNDDTGNDTDDGDDVMILRNMKFMLMIAMMMLQQW